MPKTMVISSRLDFMIILKQSAWRLVALLGVSTGVYTAKLMGFKEVEVDSLPAGILGTALSILLGLKLNAAYGRWWEARQLWGSVTNDCRSFTRQLLAYTNSFSKFSEELRIIIHRQIAFAYALKSVLRDGEELAEIKQFIPDLEHVGLSLSQNKPMHVLFLQSAAITVLKQRNALTDYQQTQLEETLSRLSNSQGGCERIKKTPFINSITVHLNAFILIYSFLLPFVMIAASDWHTIIASVIIGYVFFSLNTIAAHLEKPFENYFYDIPMSSICRTIEINLMEACDEEQTIGFLEPLNGHLN